jgi:hypothetical protein
MTQGEHIKQQVNRLGFGAWAENIIVNFIEDWGDTMRISEGNMTIENNSYTVNALFRDGSVSISVRAYVEGEGWQTLDQNIKL